MSNNRHSQNTTLREEKTIPCKCGQRTHLILLTDGWHHHKIHGNDSLSNGKCINCHKPLDMSLAVDVSIVPEYPFATITNEYTIGGYEATQDEINAIRRKIPGWKIPDWPSNNPKAWSDVWSVLVRDYYLTSCERVSFSQIVALFQSDTARNESDAKQAGVGHAKTERNTNLFGKILEKVLYIFTRSFWDAVFDRRWPK